MDKIVLVTGANGFVGRHVIRMLLLQKDVRIVATDMQSSLMNTLDVSGIPYLAGDLSDRVFVDKLASDYAFDTIIHLAAVLSQAADMSTYFSIMNANIQGTFLLCEAARKHHRARIVFPSTALVYGGQKGPFTEEMLTNPGDFYALSKLMSEDLIRFYGQRYEIASVIFRIGILYGPSQKGPMFIPSIIRTLLSEQNFPMTKGEQTRDFVFIDDFVKAIERALQNSTVSGVFNIGTGHAPTLIETAATVEMIIGGSGRIKPGAIAYREKESWEYCLNPHKANTQLDWKATTSLADGLDKTVEYERNAQ